MIDLLQHGYGAAPLQLYRAGVITHRLATVRQLDVGFGVAV
jgi:hypothetical protein